MTGKARLRRARLADAGGIFELEAHFSSDRMSLRSVKSLLRSKSARIWVAVMPRSPAAAPHVAAALILLTRRGTRVARIYSIVVAPEARGQGLAARLLRGAEAEARTARCHEMSLEVREDNLAARALYARCGYAEVALLPAYYDDGGDGVSLRKLLALSR